MTISKRDAKLLLCLAGIVIFLLLYLLVYSNFVERADAVRAETAALRPALEELREHQAHADEYNAGIEDARERMAELIPRFPADVREEDQLLFAAALEDDIGLRVSAASFLAPTPVLDFNAVVEPEDGSPYRLVPATAYSAGMSMACNLSYPQLKRAIARIYDEHELKSLESVSLSYDSETGELLGTMNVRQFFLSGLGAEHVTSAPYVRQGTNNIFGTVTTAD